MNATVNSIRGSSWRTRKGGSIKLLIELRPSTQAEWVEALETFKGRPEVTVIVAAPKEPLTQADTRWDRQTDTGWANPALVALANDAVTREARASVALDGETISACSATCLRNRGHEGEHGCWCGLVFGHAGEHIKPKRSKAK